MTGRMPWSVSALLSMLISTLLLFPGCSDDDPATSPIVTADSTPPAAVQDLAVAGPPGRRVTLSWTSPGDDGSVGRAARYQIRLAAVPITAETWASADSLASPPLPEPDQAGAAQRIDIDGLPLGAWHFALKTIDEAGNWSGLSNVVNAAVADLIPPSAVENLMVSYTTSHAAGLTWTAPGGDGSSGRATSYDLRFALALITEETWTAATPAAGLPVPLAAGAAESFEVAGLETGLLYSFAIKAVDEGANWSPLSNLANATIADLEAPGRIDDLQGCSSTPGDVVLAWTAPGNNTEVGTASEYDIRYATSTIWYENWDSATRVAGIPSPAPAGTPELFALSGLEPGRTYYFVMRTADDVPNWSGLSNIAVLTVATPGLRRLTNGPYQSHGGFSAGGVSSLTWSPDGETIAFSADWARPSEHETQLYRVPAGACSAPILLHDPQGVCDGPTWSPDGTKLAFCATAHLGSSDLWIIDAAEGAAPSRLAAHADRYITSPAWSPAGTHVVYCGYRPDSTLANEVYVVSAAGGSPVMLTARSYRSSEPSWSPDGGAIAFQSDRGGDSDIWVIPSGGGESIQLTDSAAWDGSPEWSPDGSRIAFKSNRSGDYDLWVMAADGSDLLQLTTDPDLEDDLRWSPDGGRIAFSSGPREDRDLWVVGADGSDLHRISTGPPGERRPVWSPDGGRIAFLSEKGRAEWNHDIWIVQVD